MKSQGIWQEFPRKWGFKLGLIAFAGLWLLVVANSWAGEAAESIETGGNRAPASVGDEYNFSWLDPEKKIYVLQNRRYTKANKLLLSVLAGPGSSNAYRNTMGVSGRGAYFFSEWLGVEFFYTYQSSSDNSTFEALRNATANIIPQIRDVKSQVGAQLMFVPWYAKINVFNRIIYFDWYFNLGGGQVGTRLDTRTNAANASSYLNENFGAVFIGTGHLFHISDQFNVRLDASGAYYQAPISGAAGSKSWTSNWLYSLGFGLRI